MRKQAPKLRLEVIAENSISDLLRREADIAIRHIRPTEPDLIAKLVVEHDTCFCASQGYLDRHGTPQSLADLQDHQFVGFDRFEEMEGHFKNMGLALRADQFPVFSCDGNVSLQLVALGQGVSVMPISFVKAFPGIIRVLPDVMPVSFSSWLIAHRELHVAERIRFVFDMLAEGISAYEAQA